MVVIALAAIVALAPPDDEPLRQAAPVLRPAAAAPDPIGRPASHRRPATRPDLSVPVDPYRSEQLSVEPARPDPQHPSLAPVPDEVGGEAQPPGRVSPVPPDPWAPTVPPLEPPGGDVRPPGSAG